MKELIKKFLELYGGKELTEKFDKVKVEEVEVGNAHAFADLYGLGYNSFCRTRNNPCDVPPEQIVLEMLAEPTGWRPSYYLWVCKNGGDLEGCDIIRIMINTVEDWADEELIARLACTLDDDCTKAVIITEDSWDWDVYVLISKDEEKEIDKILDEMEEYDRWLASKIDEYEEIDEEKYQHYGDCRYSDPSECYEEFKKETRR